MDTNMNMGQSQEKKGNGSAVAIIVIVIVLLAGAWYMWSGRSASTGTEGDAVENQVGDLDGATATETMLNTQSNTDDINSIEVDAKATNLEAI